MAVRDARTTGNAECSRRSKGAPYLWNVWRVLEEDLWQWRGGALMAARIVSSKDKEKVKAWAKKTGRKILWKDEHGFWHAAMGPNSTPDWCAEKEVLK